MEFDKGHFSHDMVIDENASLYRHKSWSSSDHKLGLKINKDGCNLIWKIAIAIESKRYQVGQTLGNEIQEDFNHAVAEIGSKLFKSARTQWREETPKVVL